MDLSAELNSRVSLYFEKLENELNANSIPYGDINPGNWYHCWQIKSLGGAFKIPKDEDAFNLPPPQCGNVKEVMIQERDKNKVLVRRILGYTACSRIQFAETEEQIARVLKPLITDMLLSLEQAVGFSYKDVHHGQYANFKRPGACKHEPQIYFREMQDSAGYELRLFSDTYPALNYKE